MAMRTLNSIVVEASAGIGSIYGPIAFEDWPDGNRRPTINV
jgi:hypothetical protein